VEVVETVCDWARLSPKLSGLDLRPYLFVTKDKKDYFGPVSVLGHLAGVVEKLFGGKMTVQGYEAELKQLVQPEAEKVFEAVRTKIMSTGSLRHQAGGCRWPCRPREGATRLAGPVDGFPGGIAKWQVRPMGCQRLAGCHQRCRMCHSPDEAAGRLEQGHQQPRPQGKRRSGAQGREGRR
jgi:hypothetical protein